MFLLWLIKLLALEITFCPVHEVNLPWASQGLAQTFFNIVPSGRMSPNRCHYCSPVFVCSIFPLHSLFSLHHFYMKRKMNLINFFRQASWDHSIAKPKTQLTEWLITFSFTELHLRDRIKSWFKALSTSTLLDNVFL